MTSPVFWGTKLHINTTTFGQQGNADIAAIPGGGFVVTWVDKGEIRAQIFNADGSRKGAEITVRDDSYYTAKVPAIAVLSDGRFVIAWSADNGESSSSGEVWARIFNGNGSPAGDQFQVNLWNTSGKQHEPSVTALPNGGFVISYTDTGIEAPDGNGDAVRAQAYDASGNRLGSEVAVNATVAGNQNGSFVLGLGDRYAVFFNDTSATSGTGLTVKGRIFSAEGEQRKAEFLIPATPDRQAVPKAVVLKDGRFVVTWLSIAGDGNGYCVKAKIFNADGTSASGEFIANKMTAGNQGWPSATALPDGGFAIAYQEQSSLGLNFYLATFDANGQRAGDTDLLIGSANDGNGIQLLDLATLADGRIVATWGDGHSTADPDGGIFGQIIDPRASGVNLNGTGGNDDYIGTRFNDVLNGAAGADTLNGGDGDDTYHVDQAGDVVIDSSGSDTVVASFSYTLGAGIENLTASGAGAISLTGNELANAITGNAADNTIDGGAGADRMDGGAGNDTYMVDNAGDMMIDAAGIDTVVASISHALSAEMENLTASGAGAINLTGNALANAITGNAGANRIYGGSGNDVLTGGAGADVFVLNAKLGTYKTNKRVNLDTITDFNVKDDAIQLENKIFKKLGKKGSESKPYKLKKDFFTVGSKAKDKTDYLIYDKKKGKLFYDADGSGSKKAIEIAKLDKKLKMTYKDFFIV